MGSWGDGITGESSCDDLSSIPGPHMEVEGENRLPRLFSGSHTRAVVHALACCYLCTSTDTTTAKYTGNQSASKRTHELSPWFSLVTSGLIRAWLKIGLNSHIKEMSCGMARHMREQLPLSLSPQRAGERVSTGTCKSWIQASGCPLNCSCHVGP